MINCKCQIDKAIESVEKEYKLRVETYGNGDEVESCYSLLEELYDEWAFSPICSGTPMDLCLSSCTYLSK